MTALRSVPVLDVLTVPYVSQHGLSRDLLRRMASAENGEGEALRCFLRLRRLRQQNQAGLPVILADATGVQQVKL
jgi:hypothetical protein